MKRALYIGKFQPFHLGHLDIVKQIASASDIDEIIICIGSAQWNFKNRNPERPWLDNFLTWQERKEIIERSLAGIVSKKVHILPVTDFLPKWGPDSTPQWFNYIKNHSPEFAVLYTNRKKEIELFGKEGFATRTHLLKYNFSATMVREKMALKAAWEPMVSPNAVETLRKFDAESRLADLFSKTTIQPEEYEDLSWEWRTFDQLKKEDIKKILNLPFYKDGEILDEYLFSLVRIIVNFKIRKNGLKVKKLLCRQPQGIEAWDSFDADFPIERDSFVEGCKNIRFPMPLKLPENIERENLLSALPTEYNPYVFLFSLKKKRYMRLFQNGKIRCGVDFNLFDIRGRAYTSVGLESKNKEDVLAVTQELGLAAYQPTNYLQFIEKIILKEAGNDIWKKL